MAIPWIVSGITGYLASAGVDDMKRYDWRLMLHCAVLLSFVLIIVSCSSGSDSPEARVRALLERGEVAAKKKETGVLRRIISEQYSDSQGQDKQAIEAVLRYYFLRNDSIHLLTRVQSITFPETTRALVIMLVAMTGQPISDAKELARLHADLHRFELTLNLESKEWKVSRAEWRRTELGDFF